MPDEDLRDRLAVPPRIEARDSVPVGECVLEERTSSFVRQRAVLAFQECRK